MSEPTLIERLEASSGPAGQLRALSKNELFANAPLAVLVLNCAANDIDEAATELKRLAERERRLTEAVNEFDRLSLIIESAVRRGDGPGQYAKVRALINQVRALAAPPEAER